MKGLILKDLINMKKNFRFMSAFALIYVIMAFSMESPGYFSSMFTLVFAMLTLSSYSLDEQAKWDGYALTMPISRDNVVQGKYLFMLVLNLLGLAMNTVVIVLMNVIMKADTIFSGIGGGVIGAAFVILFYSISIPMITKYGVEKSRFILIAIYMIPFITWLGIFKVLRERYPEPPEALVRMAASLMEYIYLIAPILILVFLLLSYRITIGIYRKKEF